MANGDAGAQQSMQQIDTVCPNNNRRMPPNNRAEKLPVNYSYSAPFSRRGRASGGRVSLSRSSRWPGRLLLRFGR